MHKDHTEWPTDGLEFAAWALTDEGRFAIAKRIQRQRRPHLISGRIGESLDCRVIALEKAIDAIGSNPRHWGERLTSGVSLKLFAHAKSARSLLSEFELLRSNLEESRVANEEWTQRQARVNDFRERLDLEVAALKEVLDLAGPPLT